MSIFRLDQKSRMLLFLIGICNCIAGTALVEQYRIFAAVCLVSGGLSLLLSQKDAVALSYSHPILRQPPLSIEVLLIGFALVLGAYNCFSYLTSMEGFHYDVAEFFPLARDAMRGLSYPYSLFVSFFTHGPHQMLVGIIFKYFGTGLFQLRILGAVYGFLTIPLCYIYMRIIYNRGMAALSAALFSASLWNFTLSKVATWDTAAPFLTVSTMILTILIITSRKRIRYSLLHLFCLLFGLNVYEAYRLIYPVIGLVAFYYLISDRKLVYRFLLVIGSLVLSIIIQSTIIDGLFWERVFGSKLLHDRGSRDLGFYGRNLVGKLFTGTYDIYLSQSQGAIDHPVIIGLFLAGTMILLLRFYQRVNLINLTWLALPVFGAFIFEGQWRRASTAMPIMYMIAAIPICLLVLYMSELFPVLRSSATKLSFTIPAFVLMGFALYNSYLFDAIQKNRWGGYYVSMQEINASSYAARLVTKAPLYVYADCHDRMWDFIYTLQEKGTTFVYRFNENIIPPFSENSDRMMTLLDAAVATPEKKSYFILANEVRTKDLINHLELVKKEQPSLIHKEAIPGSDDQFVLYVIGT